ncbi:hypothetical protein BC936DRAFT_143225 [Jimgerdemannia flammicorona]|uniref:Uncharacterized protein n=1 Tax=Jimgerdemannia flammicorona TaxID=994334 RepID=A0A432ZZD4_9FUNG|nr:hypothetical protein BC936DRAFT_143225 [Jimgerdemannia flammicorona]
MNRYWCSKAPRQPISWLSITIANKNRKTLKTDCKRFSRGTTVTFYAVKKPFFKVKCFARNYPENVVGSIELADGWKLS